MSDEQILICMGTFGILIYLVLMGISIYKTDDIDAWCIDAWCTGAWCTGAFLVGFTIILFIVRMIF